MYAHILHPTDLSNNHFALCQKAINIAQHFNAKLYLLHAIEPPLSLQVAQALGFAEFDRPTQIKEDAEAVMKALGEALNIPAEQQIVAIGSIKQLVLSMVNELDCDLIIVGQHTNKLPAFLESSAHGILHEAKCDVLSVYG